MSTDIGSERATGLPDVLGAVELLREHDADTAGQVARLLAGPRGPLLVAGSPGRDLRSVAHGLRSHGLGSICTTVDAGAPPTAMLWVFDAAAVPSPPEWRLLGSSADRCDLVLLAMTGTDRHRGWRSVLAEITTELPRELPRLAGCPIHPIAPHLDDRVPGAPPALRSVLRERSGMAALAATVLAAHDPADPVAARRAALRLLHAGIRAAIAETRGRQDTARQAMTPLARDRKRRRRDANARRRSVRTGRPALRSELARARLSLGSELTLRISALQREAQRHVDGAGRAGRMQLPALLEQAVRALCAQLGGSLGRAIDRLIECSAEPGGTELGAAPHAELTKELPPPRLRAPQRGGAPEDRIFALFGAAGGAGIGRLALLPAVGLPALWGAALVPLSIGIGVGGALWMILARRVIAERARLNRWLTECLNEVRAALDTALADRLIHAEQLISTAAQEHGVHSLGALDAEVHRLEAELRVIESTYAAETDARERLVARLDAHGSALARLLAEGVEA